MPKIPGVNHLAAVRALEKAGFRILRQGKHIVMSDGIRILTLPRHNPVNAFTMGGIARDAGLSVEEFKKLRVVDESGEDYLYPAEYFVFVELPKSVEKPLLRAA